MSIANPVHELASYVAKHAARCRSEGWLSSLFHVRVTEDIVAEVVLNEAKACASAHKSECADNEAARCIESALSDGRLDAGDLPLLKQALRHVQASSRADHEIGEVLA